MKTISTRLLFLAGATLALTTLSGQAQTSDNFDSITPDQSGQPYTTDTNGETVFNTGTATLLAGQDPSFATFNGDSAFSNVYLVDTNPAVGQVNGAVGFVDNSYLATDGFAPSASGPLSVSGNLVIQDQAGPSQQFFISDRVGTLGPDTTFFGQPLGLRFTIVDNGSTATFSVSSNPGDNNYPTVVNAQTLYSSSLITPISTAYGDNLAFSLTDTGSEVSFTLTDVTTGESTSLSDFAVSASTVPLGSGVEFSSDGTLDQNYQLLDNVQIAVPEPPVALLILAGGAGLTVLVRRRCGATV